MPTIILVNTRPCMIQLPPVAAKLSKGTEVVVAAVLDAHNVLVTPAVLMEPNLVMREGYDLQQLVPGQNTVDAAYWELVAQRKAIKMLIATGVLDDSMGAGTADAVVDALDDLPLLLAKQKIMECKNMGLLDAWAEGTEQLGLKSAIKERKLMLIDQAAARPVRGAGVADTDAGTFGDNTTSRQVAGDGAPAFGVGEQQPAAAPTVEA